MVSYQIANGFSKCYWGQAVTKVFAELRSWIPRFIAGRQEIQKSTINFFKTITIQWFYVQAYSSFSSLDLGSMPMPILFTVKSLKYIGQCSYTLIIILELSQFYNIPHIDWKGTCW